MLNVGLQIFNVSEPSNPTPPSECASVNYSENASGLDAWVYTFDMDGDGEDENVGFVFTSNFSNDEIRVIHDQPGAC